LFVWLGLPLSTAISLQPEKIYIINRCIYLKNKAMVNSTQETPKPDKKELTHITAKPQEQQEEPPNKGDGPK
jgi:hypothetical protein